MQKIPAFEGGDFLLWITLLLSIPYRYRVTDAEHLVGDWFNERVLRISTLFREIGTDIVVFL